MPTHPTTKQDLKWTIVAHHAIANLQRSLGVELDDDTRKKLCWEMHPATFMRGRKHGLFDPAASTLGPLKFELLGILVKHSYNVKEDSLRLSFSTESALP